MELIKSAGKINKLACWVQSTSGVNFLMTNGNLAFEVLVDVSGVEVMLPGMRENTSLGSVPLAASAIVIFNPYISRPEKPKEVRTERGINFNLRTKERSCEHGTGGSTLWSVRGLVWDLGNAK